MMSQFNAEFDQHLTAIEPVLGTAEPAALKRSDIDLLFRPRARIVPAPSRTTAPTGTSPAAAAASASASAARIAGSNIAW